MDRNKIIVLLPEEMEALIKECFPSGKPVKEGLISLNNKHRRRVLDFFIRSLKDNEEPNYPIRVCSGGLAPLGGDFWIHRWRQVEMKMWVYPKDKKVTKVGTVYLFS